MSAIAWLLLAFSVPVQSGEVPVLEASSSVDKPATAGFFTLTWSADSATRFEIQEAGNRDFSDARRRYLGSDQATTVTGKRDGTYYYRARVVAATGQPGTWCEPVAVRVAHHSLERAWLFFGIGAVVFIASLIVILRGAGRVAGQEGVS